MIYIYCKSCHWLQDTFWSIESNPLDDLESDHMRDCLVKFKTTTMEKWLVEELGIPYEVTEGGCIVGSKDYVVFRLQEAINKITNMRFRTAEEWKNYKLFNGGKCPVCGEQTLTEGKE